MLKSLIWSWSAAQRTAQSMRCSSPGHAPWAAWIAEPPCRSSSQTGSSGHPMFRTIMAARCHLPRELQHPPAKETQQGSQATAGCNHTCTLIASLHCANSATCSTCSLPCISGPVSSSMHPTTSRVSKLPHAVKWPRAGSFSHTLSTNTWDQTGTVQHSCQLHW